MEGVNEVSRIVCCKRLNESRGVGIGSMQGERVELAVRYIMVT